MRSRSSLRWACATANTMRTISLPRKPLVAVVSAMMSMSPSFICWRPLLDDWSFALDVGWEDMSGASPWFVGESANGDPKVIMSGASIEDTRTEVSGTTRYYFDRGNVGVNYTHSDEDDYESNAGGVDGAFNSEDGLTTYSARTQRLA